MNRFSHPVAVFRRFADSLPDCGLFSRCRGDRLVELFLAAFPSQERPAESVASRRSDESLLLTRLLFCYFVRRLFQRLGLDESLLWPDDAQKEAFDRFYFPLEEDFLRRNVDWTDLEAADLRRWSFSAFDPFGTLYQSVFDPVKRRRLGEFYTPEALVAALIDSTVQTARFEAFSPAVLAHDSSSGATNDFASIPAQNDAVFGQKNGQGFLPNPAAIPSVLDPACGSGRFLIAWFRRLKASGFSATQILPRLAGFDINRLSVFTARANLSLEWAKSGEKFPLRTLSIHQRDALGDVADVNRDESDRFDLLIGNPPWIHWDRLPESYRREIEPLWRRFGLFNLSGGRSLLGGGKKEFAGLFILATAARFLKSNGWLAAVIPLALLKSGASGEGFRRLGGDKSARMALYRVDDYSNAKPFAPLGTVAATIVLRRGESTRFPVPGRFWTRTKADFRVVGTFRAVPSEPHRPESTLKFIPDSPKHPDGDASAHDSQGEGGPLFAGCLSHNSEEGVAQNGARTLFDRPIARLGVNTAGANGLFWLVPADRVAANALERGDPTAKMKNLPALGKRPFSQIEAILETALLFPLLRWRDVGPFSADPSVWLLMPHDAHKRRGIDKKSLAEQFPLTNAYLAPYKAQLLERAAYRRWSPNGPFWSLFNICADSLAPYKVVWRRMDRRLNAAAVLSDSSRPILPQETLSFIPVKSPAEADYYAALLNSDTVRERAASVSLAGSKGFGSPGLFRLLNLDPFDLSRSEHQRLANEGAAQRKRKIG